MAKGGARPGSGRKPGTKNRRTVEQVEAVIASGLTPLDFMLSVMRDVKEDKGRRIEAAKSAAPYCHARLNAIEHSGAIAGLTHEEWLSTLDG